MSVMRLGRRAALLFLPIAFVACRTTVETPGATPAPADTPSPTSESPTDCTPARGGADGVLVFLTDVRVSAGADSDSVTFEFQAAPESPSKVPAYETRAGGKPPFKKDPSEEPLVVEGSSFMGIIFHGATGYDMSGGGRETYTGPREFKPGFEVLVEAEEQGDFEATLGWLFGLSRPSCWKVTEQTEPLRAVVEFPH